MASQGTESGYRSQLSRFFRKYLRNVIFGDFICTSHFRTGHTSKNKKNQTGTSFWFGFISIFLVPVITRAKLIFLHTFFHFAAKNWEKVKKSSGVSCFGNKNFRKFEIFELVRIMKNVKQVIAILTDSRTPEMRLSALSRVYLRFELLFVLCVTTGAEF